MINAARRLYLLEKETGRKKSDKTFATVIHTKTQTNFGRLLTDPFPRHRSTSLNFGQICRLSRDTPVSQALHLSIGVFTGTPPATDWKRPPGRPWRTWLLQQVEEDMSIHNPGPLVVEIATTLSRSSAAVSKFV